MDKYEAYSKIKELKARQLLHEYYQYKVMEKQRDKERKQVKEICSFILDNECLEMGKDTNKSDQLQMLNQIVLKQFPGSSEV